MDEIIAYYLPRLQALIPQEWALYISIFLVFTIVVLIDRAVNLNDRR